MRTVKTPSDQPSDSFINYWAEEKYGFDLGVHECGYEFCDPLHFWGPARKMFFSLHYVLSGEGVLYQNGKEYPIGPKMGFLLMPSVTCKYTASETNPWEYRWVGFSGSKAWDILQKCSINADNPVFYYDKDDFFPSMMERIYNASHTQYVSELLMVGYLNLLLARLVLEFRDTSNQDMDIGHEYVNSAIRYIHSHYTGRCTIEEIADTLKLNRSYLYKLFIKYQKMSPNQYITQLRVSMAADLLTSGNATISEIANMVGYGDAYYFSRVFKSEKNLSPSEYREQQKKTASEKP